MFLEILQDAFFSALAAIGFAAISRPPRQAYLYCALIAACGHSLRFVLMHKDWMEINIVTATFIAALCTGFLAVLLSPMAKTPAETCLFPALLPMVPGIYAYKTFGGAVMCLLAKTPDAFNAYFYQMTSNGLTTLFILFAMAIGATIPIFLLKRIAFTATR